MYDPRYKALVDWLKTVRIEQELTVRALEALLDEPHPFVVKIESRERKLGVFEYWQYCKTLGCDPVEGLKIMEEAGNTQTPQQ